MQRSMKTRTLRTVKAAMSCFLSAGLALYMPVMALAGDWDISAGDIAVHRTSETLQNVSQGTRSENDTNPTITGTSSDHQVTIEADQGTTATVTFEDLNIDRSATGENSNGQITPGEAAVSTTGEGSAVIELNGNNNLQSGLNRAGLEKGNTGNLTIQDVNNAGATAGSLTATGNMGGAGIGGGYAGNANNITISGGTVTANGGASGSGIGGGYFGSGSYITISGGTVTADGGIGAAGIGGGGRNVAGNITGSHITISGGTVTADGGASGSGIGSGVKGNADTITISGGTVTANGGSGGSGIGGGYVGNANNITISGGTVKANGFSGGSGIGGGKSDLNGNYGNASNITISGGTVKAVGNSGGAGIGSGSDGEVNNAIIISGSANVSAAGGAAYVNYGAGAAIGNGGVDYPANTAGGENINTTGLYTTGSIKKYAAGTTLDQITGGTANLSEDPIVGTVEPPVDPDPINPNPVIPSSNTANIIQTAENSAREDNATSTAPATEKDSDAAFNAAVDMQIDDLLRQLYSLLEAGKLNEANALIAKGFVINAGTHKGFNRATLEKLGELSRAGVAVTINFTYAGVNYSVMIPAKSEIDPASLIDESGYCGFMNLM